MSKFLSWRFVLILLLSLLLLVLHEFGHWLAYRLCGHEAQVRKSILIPGIDPKKQEIIQRIKDSVASQKALMGEQRKALIKLLLQSTSEMRISLADSPSEHLFRLQNIKIFGKHAWIVNRFNAAVDSWDKARAMIGDNNAIVNKIFLRDFEWTDPSVLMDENSFSCLSSEYMFENI